MHLIESAFRELWPDREFSYVPKIKHSARFRGYNASIRLSPSTKELTVRLSKQWLPVSAEIKKGLVQDLLVRLFKQKVSKNTLHMDLYRHFLKSVSFAVPKTRTHPVLESSFTRVNDRYFGGILEKPNLVLGSGTTKLGHYDFGADTILISDILLQDERLLDYVMYHEMLHKKHKFSGQGGRHSFHSRQFREDERKFENAAQLEQELGRLVSSVGRKKRWLFF
jgi:hypothetical protein